MHMYMCQCKTVGVAKHIYEKVQAVGATEVGKVLRHDFQPQDQKTRLRE